MYAFHNFSSSMVDDYASFLELSEECVVSLLQNEHLQAPETVVLDAVLTWVKHRAAERTTALAPLLQHAVRLEDMTSQQLADLAQDPHVRTDSASSSVVTQAVLARLTGGGTAEVQQQADSTLKPECKKRRMDNNHLGMEFCM
eukprot:jgi/Chrzof1/5265/Cz15g20010.t1